MMRGRWWFLWLVEHMDRAERSTLKMTNDTFSPRPKCNGTPHRRAEPLHVNRQYSTVDAHRNAPPQRWGRADRGHQLPVQLCMELRNLNLNLVSVCH